MNRVIKNISHLIPDKMYLKIMYYRHFHKKLNLNDPKTFNEKLQWLKLNDFHEDYVIMADKYRVKEYIANKIGNQYVVPLLGVWERSEDIDLNRMPNKFVLKCNHDSHTVFVCNNKQNFDINEIRKVLNVALKKNGYWYGRERPYKYIKPLIIAEEFLEEKGEKSLTDYKVLCFNGKAKVIEIHKGRFTDSYTQDFYSTSWEKLNISQEGSASDHLLEKPLCFEKMIELSETLSRDLKHLRVDWYIIDGKLYFGELTFYDGAGFVPFDNPEDDIYLGSLLRLE